MKAEVGCEFADHSSVLIATPYDHSALVEWASLETGLICPLSP
jgi:hypothetical protein